MPDLKEILKEFVATANAGEYKTEGELLSAFPELSGYNSNTLKEFVATANAGEYTSEDELLAAFPEFGEPVKKKEESSVPLWLQKQEQPKPKPKQEQTPPFLESKPSGISLGSQRVPETAPMFEAPPMRTAEEAQAIVEAPQTADSEQGWLLNTVSALDKGFAKNLIGNPVKGMGTLLEGATAKVFGGTGKGPISDALISFGNYYNNAIDELTPQDEDFKNTLTDQFGQAFGQVASLIMTGGVAGAGKEGAALAATAPTGIVGTVAGAGKQLASTLVSPTAISGGLSMGQAEFDRAKEAGATDEQAYEVFFKNAAVGSVLEQIPVMQFLKRFNQSTAGGVANYIKTKGVAGLTGGFEEMTTEVLQQLYSNKTAQEIYNINQELLEGVGESGGVGFGVGFILNAMGAKVKKLKKEGNTAEAQLIENQIENFESKPKGPPPIYSVNGIKIESPEVINQMIDNMDATDLANSNIEITNDPELSVKMQDKMVTSSIKEEVRSANPDIDEDTLDQITALEKERKKFEGKKTQSAKDKLASINSQIKTLQENAVQKPSTEESVLRAEESQVGLQEVGEGNAKEQAPAQEVVKEEVDLKSDIEKRRQEELDSVDISKGGKVPLEGYEEFYKKVNEKYDAELAALEQPKEAVTPEEDLQAVLDRIEIPEDTEAVQPIKAPRNKAERKAAARKGDMVYHNFFGDIIESTREQYNNALKEIAETGAIENVFNYGKAVSPRQAPNELEIQYEPSLLDMKKEDADSDLKRRTKVEEITDKAAEAVLPATPVVAPMGEVSIESAFDEDGEMDADAEDAVRGIAKERDLGVTRDRELATVARDENGNVIGGAYTSYDNSTGEYTFDVVVSKEAEGSGVGSKLLDSVINIPYEIADENPNAKVKVDVVSPQMQAMLEKRGFEVTEKTGVNRVTMEKAKPRRKVSSKTPKAKSVPIPVAIPKPTPKPAPAPAPKPVPAPVAEITTEEQIATANRMAEKVGGVVVWQDGDVALIRGYGAIDGKPVYAVSIGNSRTRVDIEAFTGKDISPELKEKLVNIKKDLEAKEADKPRSIIYDSDGIATSKSIPEKVKGVISGWKKLLGINANIYITTTSDASSDKNNFVGPERVIGSAPLSQGVGSARRMSDGNYYVSMSDDASLVEILEILAHEMGHVHEKEAFANAPKEVKDAIIAEHKKFIEQSKGKTAKEFVEQLRPKNVGETTEVPEGMMADGLSSYWKSFSEWYADQVSKWANTTEKPLSIVDKFFSELAQQMKKFYNSLKGKKYLPNPTVKEFLDSIAKNAVIVDVAPPSAPTSKKPPAPKPVAVVSQPTTKAVGLVSLQEEYTNKIAEVRFNSDKSRTPKQIDERVKELQAEYKKLKAEMTAPRPKAEPEAKAAPKVEAKPAPKKAAPAPKAEPVVSKKDQAEIKRLEDEIDYYQGQIENATEELGNTNYNYEEIETEVEKKKDELEGKKMSEQKREEAIDELDAKLEEAETERDTYLEQYNSELKEALREKKKAEKKLAKLQAKQVETKAEPTSVVEEDEPSYDDIKDLDPTDETNLKKMLRKLDSMDNGLGDFGRGNLSSGMAIPLARAIIKSIKVLVKAGIRIEDAISRLAIQNNLEEKDIVKMIKEVDNAQSAMKKLKDQIKAEARSATDAKNDMNQKRKNLSKVISEIEASGKISAFKAQAVINKIGKLNLDSKASVDKFIDYAGKVFADAEYANKLNTAKDTRSQIRKLSKLKEKFANLRDLGSKFAGIDPSMVEDIDEYNEMATLIRDSIKGSTTRKADVKFANMMKESDAMAYINKAMEAQQKMLLSQKQAEVQELLDIDASDLTYDQLMELVNDDKPLTKYNEGLIRAAINKAFRVYSSMIDASMRNGQDVFTEEGVAYTTNQKKVVKEFMSMDLNVLSPKQALESVDALVNFLQNQSIAKMESVLAKYKGETEMRAIEKKGIKAKPVRKYWSKGLGRLLLEQTANLPIVFERMFGGFTKGGMVEDAMGITALKNGKSKAQSESNNIVNNYVDKFYKLKPNGEVFNTAFNNIERGMVAFMSRNVIGTDSETKVEFKRRRDLIEESIAELEKGNEQEVAKAKVYQEVYDKILKDSDSIEQVQGKAAPENLEAVKFWQEEWSDKYEQLSDTALSVYNKRLEKDINYTPDRYSKLSSDTGEIDITTEDMGFLVNSGTAPLYKKETGVLMAATRPESLPKSKGTSKTNRYIDLSFDNTNSNAMYDALVDINTAAPIRQVQSALNSDSFARIMKGTGDEKLIKNRIDLYVRNIRNKNPFSNDEFSKAVKNLNRLASVGVGQALGGVLQPVKQVAPIAMNTVINAGGLDIPSIFDLAKQKFMDKSGYAIGNRGVESQAQIESLNKMIEEAAKSKPEQAIKAIEKINNWWLKSFLVKPDVYIARASWMTYYEQSLKKQGIDPASIDYNTHEINEEAANYAQRQVDRQQNVSDSDLAGALLSDKDASKQLFVKVLMPFASFRMNQSARLGSDLSTIMDKTATKEDKEIATRSIGGFAVEMAIFRAVSAASALLIAAVVKGVMGRDDDEEKDKKKNDAIVKGQLTSTVADVFSPTPLLDKGIQLGASAVLDATQDALDISEEEKLEIYSGNKQDFFQSLGLLGISGARASQLYEMSVLAAGGSYEDDYGRKKYLSEKDKEAIAALIPVAILSNIGLAPSEVNSIVRSSLADAKRSGTTVESEESKRKSEQSKIMGLNKEDLKRYYPDIYEQNYGEGTPDAEKRRLEREENQLERQMKDKDYNYQPKDGARKQGRDSRARGAARDAMRRSGR